MDGQCTTAGFDDDLFKFRQGTTFVWLLVFGGRIRSRLLGSEDSTWLAFRDPLFLNNYLVLNCIGAADIW